jgi:hypothetical protein
MAKTEQKEESLLKLQLKPIKTRIMKIQVESMPGSSYIPHRLDKAVVEAFTKRETGEVEKKEFRDFDKEYESCFYYTLNGQYGMPAGSFVGAILDTCVALNIPKTKIKRALRIIGDVIEIKYKKLNRRIDNPRRGGRNSTPDVRHRPEFIDWEVELVAQYDEEQITPEQIINLINSAGFTSGIGDWRPSSPKSSGTHGMFRVKTK